MSEIVIGKDSETILKSRLLRNYEGYRQFIHERELVGRFAKRQELFVTGPPVSEPNLEIISWIKTMPREERFLILAVAQALTQRYLVRKDLNASV